MCTPTIQQLVNITLPPPPPSVAYERAKQANWWGAPIPKISYCTSWCACMWLGGDKIAHIKRFKLKIASTFLLLFQEQKGIVESKKCSALSPIKGCETVWTGAIQSIRLREHTFGRQKPICWQVINLKAMNLKDDWLPDDDFREGFTLAHGAEGRCLPSKHAHENPLNKFLSLHPLCREVEATTREN